MDLYAKLPSTVTTQADGTNKPKYSSTDQLPDFLKKYVGNTKNNDEIAALKHKAAVLDSTRKKWARTTHAHCRNTLSCKEKRTLRAFHIQSDSHRFEDLLPLHRLWQSYMRDILDIPRLAREDIGVNKENYERLLKADYHGCMIVVSQSRCPSVLGMSGIILMETKNVFKIVTKQNQVKTIPKCGSVFVFELDGHVFTIYGTQFQVRTTDRVRRKFKMKASLDI